MKTSGIIKLLLSIFLLFAVVLGIAACTPTEDPETPNDGTNNGETPENPDNNPEVNTDPTALDGVTFTDATYDYDGKQKTITVSNLPEGATVKYTPLNRKTNAGTLKVTATVSLAGCEDKVLTATLTIIPPPQEIKPIKTKLADLTIASYNIARGGTNSSQVMNKLRAIAQEIVASGADIVGLQEVDINRSRSGNIDQLKKLSELTGMKYYKFFQGFSVSGDGEFGIAVLSKYEITESEHIRLSSRTDLDPAGLRYEYRSLGRTKIKISDEVSINFFVTHVTPPGDPYWGNSSVNTNGQGKNLRDLQFTEIAAELAKYESYILTGDFNANARWDADFKWLKDINGICVNKGEASVVTMPSWGTDGGAIDNIIYSADNFQFGAPVVGNSGNSDHNMLYSLGAYYEMRIPAQEE